MGVFSLCRCVHFYPTVHPFALLLIEVYGSNYPAVQSTSCLILSVTEEERASGSGLSTLSDLWLSM